MEIERIHSMNSIRFSSFFSSYSLSMMMGTFITGRVMTCVRHLVDFEVCEDNPIRSVLDGTRKALLLLKSSLNVKYKVNCKSG